MKSKKKKCVYISTEFPPGPGGIGIHAYNLINGLTKHAWEFLVFTNQENANEEQICDFNKQYNFKIIRLFPSPSVPSLLKKLFSIIRQIQKYKPNLIVSSGKHAIWFAAVSKIFNRKPMIIIAHGTEFGYLGKKNERINKWATSKADGWIAVSNYTCKYVKERGFKIKNESVIYNGANIEQYYPVGKKEIIQFKKNRQIENQRIILTVGSVTERKGQLNVIRTMPEILKEIPNTHYYCIGIPANREKYLEEAKKLNVQRNVHFLGKLEDKEVLLWLNSCDLFVMLSNHTSEGDFEGFGIAVLEAALCEKPAIVAKNSSGVIETIVEGETGYCVDEIDYVKIADLVLEILNNSEKLKQLGNNAYKRVIDEFTWEMQACKYNDYLSRFL